MCKRCCGCCPVARITLLAARWGKDVPDDLADVLRLPLPRVAVQDGIAREHAALANNEFVTQLLEEQGPFDLVYERHALWSHAAMAYAHAQKIPSVLEVNAPLIDEQREHRSLWDIDLARRTTRDALGPRR